MVVKIEISLEVYLLEPNKRCNEVPRSRAAGYPILKKTLFSLDACLREAPPPKASCGGQALRRRQGGGLRWG